ncbi:MAG: hypothetical protein HQL70_07835 [Magnetococcales bacterium]|nr:hypothetical protein [Magnetococcales bacterium]
MSERNVTEEATYYKAIEKSRKEPPYLFPQHPTEMPLLKGTDPKNSILFSSRSDVWNTPPEIVAKVVSVMGSIDLDPCWNSESSVQAGTVYSKKENGLIHPWGKRVFMNPPYGREVVLWVDKILEEYYASRTKEAIVLIPARTDTKWFHKFREFPVCFIKGRLRFSGSKNSATFPSAVFYLGARKERFADVFRELGIVYMRWM